jgi:protein-disulfide isomerase
MTRLSVSTLCLSLFAGATALAVMPLQASAQSVRAEIDTAIAEYLAAHPEQVQVIVKDYLTNHPEVLSEALTSLIKKRLPNAAVAQKKDAPAPANPDKTAVIQENAASILQSPHQVVLGNPNGSVTMVEFFDYNCGFCKRALGDMQTMIKDDPNLRVVLKELPILGPGSLEAAQVAVAVRMQDPSGEKYFAFHRALLGGRGHADKAVALAAAKEAGLDMARLDQDLNSAEVKDTLTESTQLARSLGINGTPGYVIGNTIVPGAIGAAGLKERVQAAAKS